jgi:hypothetical protein
MRAPVGLNPAPARQQNCVRSAKRLPRVETISRSFVSGGGIQDDDAGRLVVGTLPVTTVSPYTGAVAAICLSSGFSALWDAQLPPYLRDRLIEGEDGVSVITCDRAEPMSQASRRRDVTPMAHRFARPFDAWQPWRCRDHVC